MSESRSDPDAVDRGGLEEELRQVEAELDALRKNRSGFDFRRDVRRVRGIVLEILGRGRERGSGFEAERLSGQDLVDRMRELQRRRAELKNRLDGRD